jgi:hypothetical protein
MEQTEKTDNILFDDAKTDQISSKQNIHIPKLPDVEVNTLSKYLFVILVLITCFLTLLWSRLDINETKVAMGNAQNDYRRALEENHRLQLELNLLLDPASIERQVETWNLERNVDTIDIYEVGQ